jgi:hypothetical protein
MKADVNAPEKPKRAGAESGQMPGSGFLTEQGVHAMEGWAQSFSAMMKGPVELAQEMMRFSQARLQANVDAWKAAIACRSPDELAECQKAYAKRATDEYLAEANRLSAMMTEAMSGATVPLREQAKKP